MLRKSENWKSKDIFKPEVKWFSNAYLFIFRFRNAKFQIKKQMGIQNWSVKESLKCKTKGHLESENKGRVQIGI